MPKITEEELEKKQVALFKADLDYLRSLYGQSFSVNKAIRTLVRVYVRQIRAKSNAEIDKLSKEIESLGLEDALED